MQLPAESTTTSSSNSCQPSSERSTSTWPIGLALSPCATRSRNSGRVRAIPPPRPPSVKAGRTTAGTGQPLSCARLVTTTLKGTGSPAALHRRPEEGAVLRSANGVQIGSDQLDAVLGEHAAFSELDREVECGLAAERGEERVRRLAGDDLRERGRVERLEIGRVGPLGVGHDRGGVRVGEHDAIALGTQRTARLHAGVVELAALPDPDRAGPDDQDAAKVGSLRHAVAIRSKKGSASCGPGAASGWNCSVAKPSPESPSTVPSLSETWLTSAASPGSTAKPWFWAVTSTRREPVTRTG